MFDDEPAIVVNDQITHFSSSIAPQVAGSPLAGRPIRPAVENTPYAAIRELAAVLGVNDAAVAGSGFLARLREIARALRPDVSTRYVAALDAIGAANATLTFGCWHGDL